MEKNVIYKLSQHIFSQITLNHEIQYFALNISPYELFLPSYLRYLFVFLA